jgi:pimeloyl-ACP methyl ester carboxylesterase
MWVLPLYYPLARITPSASTQSFMGYSLGSYLAQQLTMMYPDKVNSLILVGSSCGGKDHTPTS